MSNAVFPMLPGLAWNIQRTPIWSTNRKQSVSGRRFAAANMSYPLRKYRLSFEVLRGAGGYSELQTLVGFFNARGGRFDTFLFNDPLDNTVSAQTFGTGDGSTRTFQLVRAFGGFVEPVYAVNNLAALYVAGAAKANGADYTVSASGLITFAAAPSNGAVLSWDGTFYQRCEFMQDTADFNEFMYRLFELKQLEFQTVKP